MGGCGQTAALLLSESARTTEGQWACRGGRTAGPCHHNVVMSCLCYCSTSFSSLRPAEPSSGVIRAAALGSAVYDYALSVIRVASIGDGDSQRFERCQFESRYD